MKLEDFADWAQIVGAIFIPLQLLYLAVEAKKSRLLEQKKFTLEYYSQHYQDQQKFHLWIDELKQEPLPKLSDLSQEEREMIFGYLTITERFSAGIRHEIINLKYILDTHGKRFRIVFIKLYPIIYQIRDNENTTRKWDMYEWFAYELEKKSKEKLIPSEIQVQMRNSIYRNNLLSFSKSRIS